MASKADWGVVVGSSIQDWSDACELAKLGFPSYNPSLKGIDELGDFRDPVAWLGSHGYSMFDWDSLSEVGSLSAGLKKPLGGKIG